MPAVKNLTIKLRNAGPDLSMRRAGETGRKVVEKMFGSTMSSHRSQKLRFLRIESMSFEIAGNILPAVLSLEHLDHLHLINCKHTSRLCENIMPLGLSLHSFHNQGAHCGPQEGAINAFVKSLRLLRKLRLSCDDDSEISSFDMCEWSSLIPHANELHCLDFDDYEPRIVAFSGTRRPLLDFDLFCSRASKLQQLSIKSPSLSTYRWKEVGGLQSLLVWHPQSM